MATSPSLIGYSVFVVLWAKVSVPLLLHLKNRPLTPVIIVSLTDNPRTPPIDGRVKAPKKIDFKISSSRSMFIELWSRK